jgi:hypothetical protein
MRAVDGTINKVQGVRNKKSGTSKILPKSFIEGIEEVESFYFWRASMSGHAQLLDSWV